MKEIISGAAAFVVNPNNSQQLHCITEASWKRETNKLAGMFSPPSETVEDGEDHKNALRRALTEEVTIVHGGIFIPESLEEAKISLVQLTPGVWEHVYLPEASEDLEVAQGSHRDVTSPSWVSLEEVLNSRERNCVTAYRPGMVEMVKDYHRRVRLNGRFRPGIHIQPVNSVPNSVFDSLEKGVSQR